MKFCCECKVKKHESEFNKRARASDGLASRCRECSHLYHQDYWAKNPDKRYSGRKRNIENRRAYDRERWPRKRLTKYNLTQEQYDAMLSKQDGVCAICEKVSELNFRIDHDHRCCPGSYSCGKCVRGLLCHHCNAGLGQFNDDPDTIQKASEYLQASR